MAKRKGTKQSQLRRNRADESKKAVLRKNASKRKAQGKKTAISKTLAATKRSAAAKKALVIKALTEMQRTAAQKWAWVERQLKRA